MPPLPVPTPEYIQILPWWFTPLLALLSFLISASTFGWTLYVYITKKAKVGVKLKVRKIVQSADGKWYAAEPSMPTGPSDLPGSFIVMSLVNLRERPVNWIGWGGKYKKAVNGKDSFIVVPDYLPFMLKDGDDHSQRTALDAHCLNIKSMFAWDSTGRHWKPSWWGTYKFRKEVEKALKP